MKNEIVGIQKLESITDKLVALLNYCVKPCRPIYKLFSEKVFEHSNKSQEKWQQKLGKTISHDDWTIVYSIPFDAIFNTKLQAFQYKRKEKTLKRNINTF